MAAYMSRSKRSAIEDTFLPFPGLPAAVPRKVNDSASTTASPDDIFAASCLAADDEDEEVYRAMTGRDRRRDGNSGTRRGEIDGRRLRWWLEVDKRRRRNMEKQAQSFDAANHDVPTAHGAPLHSQASSHYVASYRSSTDK